MSHSQRTRARWRAGVAPLVLLAAALAGCNGDDSPGMATAPAPPAAPAAANAVPAAALASVPAFIEFVAALRSDDTRAPLSVMGAAAPVSDSDEPQGI
jgi:hypothetical protein